jgi:hypothetical protein
MDRLRSLIGMVAVLLTTLGAVAQQASAPAPATGSDTTPPRGAATVRGCLNGQRGNYVLIEDKTGMVYVLKGVGNKLDNEVHHQVEVKGRILPGTVKTGIRGEKAGSNPSDTVHGVDGVPLQVANVQTDVREISKQCKAADQE